MKRLFFIKSMAFLLSVIIFGNIAHAAMMDKTEVTIGQFSEFIASTGWLGMQNNMVGWYMRLAGS